MPISEAALNAIKKYEAEKIDKILLRVPKGTRDIIKKHAQQFDSGSVNAFIIRAIIETIDRDNEKL